MKNTLWIRPIFLILGGLFTSGVVFAQAPNTPKIPPSDIAAKNAEAAQKAAEKAEAAKRASEKAAAASASAEKMAAAQKAAEKASVASALAEKAESAKRAADKAAAASAAAEKAAAAQKAVEKAAAASAAAEKAKAAQELSAKAQKAADKAEAASVAAAKAAAAQKAADKAAAAQKSATLADAAQKAATKAEAAQKASDKAAAAASPAEKSQAAQMVAEKAAARQAAAEKLTTLNSAAVQAEAAQKAAQNAAKVSAATTSAPAVTRIRLLNQPAPETKGGEDRKTPKFTVTGEPRNPVADRKAREEAARSVRIPELAPAPAPTPADEIRITKDRVRDGLADLEVTPEVASKLADEFVDPEKAPAARVRVEELANTSLDLQTVAVPEETRRKIIDEVSRSADPRGTANEKVGEAATEEVFGKDVAALVPVDKRGQFREVFQNLADLRSGLETIGGSPDDPEVVEAVKEGAVRGVTTREETREIFEGAGQKVLDRQGFSPAKKDENFNARLGRIAEEQKAELAALKAAKAAAAAAAAAKLAKGKITLGEGITQGAAGSTAIGRSVSARVEVAIGGGKKATSGAGRAAQGTGTDASKATGTGAQNRSELLTSRLPADTGGAFTAGQPTTGRADQAASGTASAPAASSVPTAPGALDTGLGADGSQAAEAAIPGSPSATAAGPGTPTSNTSSVDSPVGEVVIGGGVGSSFGGHFQSNDGNTGGNLTFNPDGTFAGTVTTVTRDASGNITHSAETSVVGTWGFDADGNVVVTTATVAPSTPSDNNNNQSTPPAGNQPSNGGDGSETDTSSDSSSSKDDDDDDDDNDDTPPPPPAAETTAEETPAEQSAEETKAADSTPNPMDDGGVNPLALAEQTNGRLGGAEARRQQRALQLAGSGGGAGGPNPDKTNTTPTLLTPEEQANAARLIGVKTGGGVTNPNPIKTGGIAVTDRDLKELHLRGNGGAAGPTDTTAPAPPQDPQSPLGGLAPAPIPSGGNRLEGVQAPAVRVDRIDVSGQLQENAK